MTNSSKLCALSVSAVLSPSDFYRTNPAAHLTSAGTSSIISIILEL